MITYDENILGYLLFLHTFPNVPKIKKMIDNWFAKFSTLLATFVSHPLSNGSINDLTIMPVARIYVMASLKAINSIPELLPA